MKSTPPHTAMALKLTPRLILLFTLFATLLLCSLGVPTYISARNALANAVQADLHATAVEKLAAVEAWLASHQATLTGISRAPDVLASAALLQGAAPPDTAQPHLVAELQAFVGVDMRFRRLFVLHAATGRVIASTVAADEGQLHAQAAYFLNGRNAPYVQGVQRSATEPLMTLFVATPLRQDQQLVGVLVGELQLADLTTIVQRHAGLRASEDAFLLSSASFLVTPPLLNSDPEVLQRPLPTEAGQRCLAGEHGLLFADDYRGVPAITHYDWFAVPQLCLIVKLDQHDAFAPAEALGWQVLLLGLLVESLGVLTAVLLARTITGPIQALQTTLARFTAGERTLRMNATAPDEMGALAQSMNQVLAILAEQETVLQQNAVGLQQQVATGLTELRASEERFRSLVETTSDWVWETDANHCYTYVGPRVRTLLGHEPADLLGATAWSLMAPAYGAVFQAQARTAHIADQGTYAFEFAAATHNGHGPVFLERRYTPFYDAKGAVAGFRGIDRDITGRRQFEDDLHRSRQMLQMVLDTIPQRVFWKDKALRYLGCNARFAADVGLAEAAQISGKNDTDLVWRDTLQWDTTEDAQVIATMESRLNVEEQRLGVNKTPRWLRTSRLPLYDQMGGVIGLLGVYDNITAEKQAALEFQTVINTTVDGFWISTLDGQFEFVNEAYCQMSGYSREALLDGMRIADIEAKLTAPELGAQIRELITVGHDRFDTRHRRKDGSIFDVEISVNYLQHPRPRLFCFIRDITERQRSAEELEARTESLARSNAELEQFAYVASHDLQEPLRMVSSYTQLLSRRYRGKLDTDADEFIAYAVDGANRMQKLINDLLAYSRVGTRGKPFAPVDCGVCVAQVLLNLALLVEDVKAQVTYADLPVIIGDEVQLAQLFQNLIGNALKFRGTAPPQVSVTAEWREGLWLFAVRDNGIGIAAEYFERIFVIFQRLHNRDQYPGTGIGLAICKKIVGRHGGQIWVESTPGQGTTFFFTLASDKES